MCKPIRDIFLKPIQTMGPYTKEADWIISGLTTKNYDNENMEQRFGNKIAHNIKLMNLYIWQQYYVHLTFDDMYRLFYKYESTVHMGDLLITTPFHDNYHLIQKFNQTYKNNNYQIKDPVKEIKPLFDQHIIPFYSRVLETKWSELK